MNNEKAIVAFERYNIRRLYDEKAETWYFSVVDVVGALTDSANPRDYWFKMKIRVETEDGFELSTTEANLYGRKEIRDRLCDSRNADRSRRFQGFL
ncbi:MAG: hypothetical protein ACKVRN_09595 [Pyrinomonadaceae bacterium]